MPDGEEVLQILKSERAALHYWIEVAVEYYRRGSSDDFCKILELSGGDASLDYQDYEKDQMRALDLLAAFYVLQVRWLIIFYLIKLKFIKLEIFILGE